MIIVAPMSGVVVLTPGVVALGIVFKVPVPLPEAVPIDAPAKVMPKVCEKEKLKLLDPSALCAMVVCPDARILVALLPIATLFVPE
jgi:hypothetical protein